MCYNKVVGYYNIGMIVKTDMGFDLAKISNGSETILPQCSLAISVGSLRQNNLTLQADEGCLVCVRSGLAFNHNILGHVGCVDQSYEGDIKVLLFNLGHLPYVVNTGQRIAQAVIVKLGKYNVRKTARGTDGFGSSGV